MVIICVNSDPLESILYYYDNVYMHKDMSIASCMHKSVVHDRCKHENLYVHPFPPSLHPSLPPYDFPLSAHVHVAA